MVDVIVFQVYGQYCALPTDKIREILEPLPVTPLPFTPGFVDGLVNIGGQVVVQMDLGHRLGLQKPLTGTCGILLVIDVGNGSYAIRVDQVFSRASLEEASLSACADAEEDTLSVVSGQFAWINAMVLMLSAERMGMDDIVAQGVPDGEGGLLAVGGLAEKELVAADKENTYLITMVGSEYYALALSEIMEVVELPDDITRLPHAPQEVLGLMLLRGTPLLILVLAGLLEAEGNQQVSCPFAIVVERDGRLLGLAVEKLLGIQRFGEKAMQPVENPSGDIAGYFIGKEKDSQRMIGLLSIPGLISAEHSARYRGYLVDGTSIETYQIKAVEDKKRRLLIIRLGAELFALPLSAILRIEEDLCLTPVPASANAALIGAIQVQGDVLPVIDIAVQLGLAHDAEAVFYVVVQLESERWALKVDHVERVLEVAESELELISSFTEGYLSAIGRIGGKLFSVLRLESILKHIGEQQSLEKPIKGRVH